MKKGGIAARAGKNKGNGGQHGVCLQNLDDLWPAERAETVGRAADAGAVGPAGLVAVAAAGSETCLLAFVVGLGADAAGF